MSTSRRNPLLLLLALALGLTFVDGERAGPVDVVPVSNDEAGDELHARRSPSHDALGKGPVSRVVEPEREGEASQRAPALPTALRVGGSVSVRVVVRVGTLPPDGRLPIPELLRLDEHGNPWPVKPISEELAERTARPRVRHESARRFVVDAPGRYVPAWHLWLTVPGTRTQRACRGRGAELTIRPGDPARELVIHVSPGQLQIDRRLEGSKSLTTRVTPKDGI